MDTSGMKLCVACNGEGRWWERGEPMRWRAFLEGPEYKKNGELKLSNNYIATCSVCKGKGAVPNN